MATDRRGSTGDTSDVSSKNFDKLLSRQDMDMQENEDNLGEILSEVQGKSDELLSDMLRRTDDIYNREMAMTRINRDLTGRLDKNIRRLDHRTETMTVRGENLRDRLSTNVEQQGESINRLRSRMADKEEKEFRDRKARNEKNKRLLLEHEGRTSETQTRKRTYFPGYDVDTQAVQPTGVVPETAPRRKQRPRKKKQRTRPSPQTVGTPGMGTGRTGKSARRPSRKPRAKPKYFEVNYDDDNGTLYSRVPLYCKDCGTKYDMPVELPPDSMPSHMNANCPNCQSRYRINMTKFWERADISGLPEDMRQQVMNRLYNPLELA